MKNAPTLNFDDSKITSKSIVPTVNAIKQRREIKPQKTAQGVVLKVLGRDVPIIYKTIPNNQIEEATSVYFNNIRLQDLLNEETLSDILGSFKESGQQFPAYGREISGKIEIADGSRRRKAAILTGSDYCVWIGDFTDLEMDYLSQKGNDYQSPSAYEKGRQYKNLLEDKFDNNLSKLAEKINIDRKIISRCIAAFLLPMDFIKLLKKPNSLSARAGERLSKVYKENEDLFIAKICEFEEFIDKNSMSDELIIKEFEKIGKQNKSTENTTDKRKLTEFASVVYQKDKVILTLDNAPKEVIKNIEKLLLKYNNSQ